MSPSPAASARSRWDSPACCCCGRRTASCGRSSTPAGTAGTSCSRAAPRRTGDRSSARTTPGRTTWPGRCATRPASGTSTTFDKRGVRAAAAAVAGVARLGVRRAVRRRRRLRRAHRRHRGRSSRATRPRPCASSTRTQYVIEANWKTVIENYQECYHCSMIHPELCRGQPARERGEHQREGRLGRRLDGPAPRAPRRCRWTARAASVAIDTPERAGAAHRDVPRGVPQPADQPAPRLRHDPPADAGRAEPDPDRVRVAVPAGGGGARRVSTRRTPSTSGTSRTARTGPRASRCSAGCGPSSGCRARSPRRRTASTTSSPSSRTATWVANGTHPRRSRSWCPIRPAHPGRTGHRLLDQREGVGAGGRRP